MFHLIIFKSKTQFFHYFIIFHTKYNNITRPSIRCFLSVSTFHSIILHSDIDFFFFPPRNKRKHTKRAHAYSKQNLGGKTKGQKKYKRRTKILCEEKLRWYIHKNELRKLFTMLCAKRNKKKHLARHYINVEI